MNKKLLMKITDVITSKSNPRRRKQRSRVAPLKRRLEHVVFKNHYFQRLLQRTEGRKKGQMARPEDKKGDEQDSRARAVTGNHHFAQQGEKGKREREREANAREHQTRHKMLRREK
jgi:hypothetical protein